MATPEGKITAAITRHLKRLQSAGVPIWYLKLHGGPMQRAGVPDMILFVDGHMLAIEIKKPGGEATALQVHTMAAMARAGAETAVVTSVDEVARLIEECLKP